MRTGSSRQELREALLDAFRRPGEMSIVVSNAGLGKPFANFLAAPGTAYEDAVFNLLDWVDSQNELIAFLKAAQSENPRNAKLHAVLRRLEPLERQYGLFHSDWSLAEAERLVLKGLTFEDVALWLGQLAAMRRAVCRIEPQPQDESTEGYGTGFLVAPDVVMTNFHVVERFWDVPDRARGVRVRFDYEVQPSTNVASPGTEHQLAADWTIPRWDDDARIHPWQCVSSPVAELDFALVRLATRAANDVVSGNSRGFLSLTPRAFHASDPILILQHPAAKPLKLSMGAVESSVPPNHVIYRVNTEPGSSGSPCITQDLKVTAIHHFGLAHTNRGVTHDAIMAYLIKQRAQLERLSLGSILMVRS